MVKVYLKGGVWTNSEDEVLKAAVQKYGKQQWARVASLLNKKTAKQAKARWHEWLDPAIRKTEWSRTEDEKLLHLAKLMPAQWKTIAPLVGRTATQCQARYEELLDAAATATAAAASDDADGINSLRQQTFRPGQIDSHPESKPARPDPIDMDEDELEMLQEARARLANTVGKKAKRKQREKMLAQAKRLADLQKRRELKQAGLLTDKVKRRRNRREIDLGAEIPFYKPAPAGFHDTQHEQIRSENLRQKRHRDVDLKRVNENLYRTRDKEAVQAQKREESRLRILEHSNEKYKQQAEQLDQTAKRPRVALQLPEPTITDQELSQLAKQQRLVDNMPGILGEGGSTATQALVGDYSDRPLPTPIRRPPATPGRDLNREASYLRQIERGQTPLLPGSADDDNIDDDDMKMPARKTGGDREDIRGPYPGDVSMGNSLRPDDGASVGTFVSSVRELARQERRAAKQARLALEKALEALPSPQFEYELSLPESSGTDEQQPVVTTVPDQADVEAAALQQRQRQAQEALRMRSTVLRRPDLPRPVPTTLTSNFDDVVVREMLDVIKSDALAYPLVDVETKKKSKGSTKVMEPAIEHFELEVIPLEDLDQARILVQEEYEVMMEERIGQAMRDSKAATHDDALHFLRSETIGAIQSSGKSTHPPCIKELREEWDALREATTLMHKRNEKVRPSFL